MADDAARMITHRIISLGAGVQSSDLYVRAVDGEFGDETPCAAVFADTQWEPVEVYEHLERLKTFGGAKIPIHVVTKGNIREDALATERRFASMPFFTRQEGRTRTGMLMRQCTTEYKIVPVQQAIRRIVLGLQKGQRVSKGVAVELWMGISTDEIIRMKPSRMKWITHRWPLIDLGLSRKDCADHLNGRGFRAAKSACIGCPFHDNDTWRLMRETDPKSFADAVEFDNSIRKARPKLGSELYLHRSGLPLAEAVSLSDPTNDSGGFGNECEGMCGM